MKPGELRDMSPEELRIRLRELKGDLFKATYELRSRQSEDITRRGLIKRDIARIMTILREKGEESYLPQEKTPKDKKGRKGRKKADMRKGEKESASEKKESAKVTEKKGSRKEKKAKR